ncbi:hypothetical protein [Nocardia sp. NBC_00416]|uniref:hypothetical protein n=1 Tax=Nocardia sp. NBC_00416 TaxID=2975991 RepID=UPI002E1F44A3
MPRDIEADADGLREASELIAEIKDKFSDISATATGILGDMTRACGDDHFGHKFTDGKEGYRARCDNLVARNDDLAGAFDDYASSLGDAGAAGAWDGSESLSAAEQRRAV